MASKGSFKLVNGREVPMTAEDVAQRDADEAAWVEQRPARLAARAERRRRAEAIAGLLDTVEALAARVTELETDVTRLKAGQ